MLPVVITSRPLTTSSDAYVLLERPDRRLEKYVLDNGDPLLITVSDANKKYCVGWYDVTTHTNHVCEARREVEEKYESCFDCRKKTGFNPAFYNTSDISPVQQAYNSKPHSVYVSYFGDGLAKAGIMSDSRGLDRLFEQGAIFYCVVGCFATAEAAHSIEVRLISQGLKNSVSKRQKENVLSKPFDETAEREVFLQVLKGLGLADKKVVSNLDHFFFGKYEGRGIEPLRDNPISGTVRGIVGSYLVLDNHNRLYGYWLGNLVGHLVELNKEIKEIQTKPEQISLFE